jgi:ethanolamine kinase|mmetsp:Transcript_723/g.2079  ORF Transcript_723/g.2079 Transcript_723/m.2079 type:complete len:122 (-) Transcript_723:814-1179(-)
MGHKGSETCLIWKWIDLMLQEIEDSAKELPSFVNYEILREEVRKNRSIIEEAKFPVTLTHGDLKPSNIMILEDNSLKLIDLELSGLNYRGFDLMKLYRADCKVFSVRIPFQRHFHVDFPYT